MLGLPRLHGSWVPLLLMIALGCTHASPEAPPRAPQATQFPRAEDFASQEIVDPYTPYAVRRAAHETQVSATGPAVPGAWGSPPEGAREVRYPSDGRDLRGWLFVPPTTPSLSLPAVVYLHNDFALTRRSWANTQALRDAGFIVFLPALRAENGNPGDFELLYGEVDDAANAVRWLATQPAVDRERIYVIGHSIGGGIASLLSLRPDLPVRRTASIGGTYRARTFHVWALQPETKHLIRFDLDDSDEVALRLLIPNLPDVVRPHLVYAGADAPRDVAYARHARQLAYRAGAPVELVVVPGDHMGSAVPAVAHLVEVIKADAAVAPD